MASRCAADKLLFNCARALRLVPRYLYRGARNTAIFVNLLNRSLDFGAFPPRHRNIAKHHTGVGSVCSNIGTHFEVPATGNRWVGPEFLLDEEEKSVSSSPRLR